MKKLFLKILLLVPLPAIVMATNLLVDPAKIYSTGDYEYGIARHLLEGSNVENLANYDERLLQEYLIEGFAAPRDVAVLGSSRTMQVSREIFPGRSFMNNSVSGATLEDLLGLYELYRDQALLPATIVLGLDPWTLNRNHGQVRWKTLSAFYAAALRRLDLGTAGDRALLQDDIIPYRYFELFSPSYFQQSVKALFKDKRQSYNPTRLTQGEHNIKLSDGSLSYNAAYREAPLDAINQKAVQEAFEDPVYSLGDFHRLDAAYMRQLEALVDDYTAQGGELVFFLAPYHPKFYEAVVNNHKYQMLRQAEGYYRSLAEQRGLRVIGSYDPAKLALAEFDFYDGMHLKRSATERLFASARSGQ